MNYNDQYEIDILYYSASTEFPVNSVASDFPVNESLPESKKNGNNEINSDQYFGEEVEKSRHLETHKLTARQIIDRRFLHMSGGTMFIAPEPAPYTEVKIYLPIRSYFLKEKISAKSNFIGNLKTSDILYTNLYRSIARRKKFQLLDGNVKQHQDPSTINLQLKQETTEPFEIFCDLNSSSDFADNEMETDSDE